MSYVNVRDFRVNANEALLSDLMQKCNAELQQQ